MGTNPVLNLSALFGDKPAYKSMTAWGLVIFVMAEAAAGEVCDAGLISVAACSTVATVLKYVGGVLTVLGLRRAATAPNTA